MPCWSVTFMVGSRVAPGAEAAVGSRAGAVPKTPSPFPAPATSNRSCGCRDRNRVRAPVGGGLPRPPFRLRPGVTVPPWVTFHEAPLRSRTVGFPESGSDLGSARHFSDVGLPSRPWGSSAGAHPPQSPPVYPHPCPERDGSCRNIGAIIRHHSLTVMLRSAECPEPLCLWWAVTPSQGVLREHLGRRYPSVLAPAGSCARPCPSPRLDTQPLAGRSVRVVASPCWEMALPNVISAIRA